MLTAGLDLQRAEFLLLVMGFRAASPACGTPLECVDFLRLVGRRSFPLPKEIVAVSQSEKMQVQDPAVTKVHRPGCNWDWETDAPESFPDPPFLLTDDDRYCCIFRGAVAIETRIEFGEMRAIEASLPRWDGKCVVAVNSSDWLGELCVEPGSDWKQGQLVAFSAQIAALPQARRDVELPDFEEILGTLIPRPPRKGST